MFEWDEDKRRENLRKHGVDLREIGRFEWASAFITPDDRRDYGERRMSATGMIGGRLFVCVFTPRNGNTRIISLRKANRRDMRKWHTARS